MSASPSPLRTWVPTMVFNVALPIATYIVLSGNGMADVPALILSGIWPVVELGLSYARTRHFDELSIMVLIFLVIGVLTSLLFTSARVLLIKESALTGLFGVVLLASLLAKRPLMFYFGRKFATDGTPEKIAWWNGLWQYEGFRRGQRMLTVVWGVAFLGEAVLRILLGLFLPVATMVVINNVLPYVVLAALVVGTSMWGRRQQAAREQAAAA
ncbi:VC0807 family protein [Labedaea rhizosphaerae]|nr:VC0807 family protein [Labedaea rhizosphaerae]